jgi:N-acetylglucosaminyldiphosphoundecaprenol N-acetyl-beta-D-mannosaminyltransferase
MPPLEALATTDVLGVAVSAVNLESATRRVIGWIERGERAYVTVTGVHGVMEAQSDPAFRAILNRAGMTVPDGMPLAWLSRAAGHAHVTRVPGPDLLPLISRAMAERGMRAFYYGGAEGVADDLARRMEARFPGLVTAGTFCPPFRALSAEEEADITDTINRAKPDAVWVGLSTPKQELWMDRFRPLLDAPVLLGVGAAFDFHTGRIRRAPRWMQSSGLEWAYRLSQDPRRLAGRYLRNNPLFLCCVAADALGLYRGRHN